jgi:ribonuclease D
MPRRKGLRRDSASKLLVDRTAWEIGAVCVLVGIGLMYLSAQMEGPHGPTPLDTAIREAGALLFVTAALSVLWDLRGRRNLADELLTAVGVSSSLSDAGLVRVTTDYGQIEWDKLINSASHVDPFFTYAHTWRNSHETALRTLVERGDTQLRVILADRLNQTLLAHLAARFNASPEDVAATIEEAEHGWVQLARIKGEGAEVELRVTTSFPVFTYYRFDGRCVGVFYGQARKRTDVPALECQRGGSLYTFFSEQFEGPLERCLRPIHGVACAPMARVLAEAKDTLPLRMFEGDLEEDAFDRALEAPVIGWDIETTGLDWRTERIAVVQLQVGEETYLVRVNGHQPYHLKALMENQAILKVFHHAMFDLRFLAHQWGIRPANVACTKIASKLVEPNVPHKKHSLASLARRYLGIRLNKTARLSDWTGDLSPAQLRYAANDVRYLQRLHRALEEEIRQKNLLDLRERCYSHLSTQVELEVSGFPDVYSY